MNNALVIDELKQVAQTPNGFDRSILMLIQENIACDVMKLYRADLVDLMRSQSERGLPKERAEAERKQFFAEKLQQEYRNRAANGAGFNLPMYLEMAENHYRLDIRRCLQQVQDYIAHGRVVAETHLAGTVREMRSVDPGMADLSAKVADSLNALNDSLEKLSRLRLKSAGAVAKELQLELQNGLGHIQRDSFSRSMLQEATNLADARRELGRFEDREENTLSLKNR